MKIASPSCLPEWLLRLLGLLPEGRLLLLQLRHGCPSGCCVYWVLFEMTGSPFYHYNWDPIMHQLLWIPFVGVDLCVNTNHVVWISSYRCPSSLSLDCDLQILSI